MTTRLDTIRLVRMHFHPRHVKQFLALYHQAQPMIRAQPGCRSVLLVRQTDDVAAFATWSVWDDDAVLDAYRTSAFFRGFWPQVKALFRAPAEAVSFKQIERLEG